MRTQIPQTPDTELSLLRQSASGTIERLLLDSRNLPPNSNPFGILVLWSLSWAPRSGCVDPKPLSCFATAPSKSLQALPLANRLM